MATGKKDRKASDKKPKSQGINRQLSNKSKPNKISPVDLSFTKSYEKQVEDIRIKELQRNKEQLREQIKTLSEKNEFLVENLKQSEKELLQLTAYIKEKESKKDYMIENLHYLLKITIEQDKKRIEELENFYQKKIKNIYLSIETDAENTKERLQGGGNALETPASLNGQLQEIQNIHQMLVTQLLKELDPLAEETLENHECKNNVRWCPADTVTTQGNFDSKALYLKNRGDISKLTRRLQTSLTNLVNVINNDLMAVREKQQHFTKVEQAQIKLEQQINAKDQEILALRTELDKLRKLQSQHVDLTVSQLVNEILTLRKELRNRDEEIDVLKNWASVFSEKCQQCNEDENQNLIPKEKIMKILAKTSPKVRTVCSLQSLVQNPLHLKKPCKSQSKTVVM